MKLLLLTTSLLFSSFSLFALDLDEESTRIKLNPAEHKSEYHAEYKSADKPSEAKSNKESRHKKTIKYKQAVAHPDNQAARLANTKPEILNILYTGESLEEALKTFADPKERMSVHYLIAEEGEVYRLVEEKDCAWHAGPSNWGDINGVNQYSIGIALVNKGISEEQAKTNGWNATYPKYTAAQIESLIALSKSIITRFEIKPWNVVGHSDIAPQRKLDPGANFPWDYLARNGIGFWPKKRNREQLLSPSALSLNEQKDFLTKLARYGYRVPEYKSTAQEQNFYHSEPVKKVVAAFQAHFRPEKINGEIDSETAAILDDLLQMKKEAAATPI